MNILITYHSYFGNTKKTAETIYKYLKQYYNVHLAHVEEYNITKNTRLYDLLIVGSATRYNNPSKSIVKYLKDIRSYKDQKIILFDTRMEKNIFPNRISSIFLKKRYYALDKMKKIIVKKKHIFLGGKGFYINDSDGPFGIKEENTIKEWLKFTFLKVLKSNYLIREIVLDDIQQYEELTKPSMLYHKYYKPYKNKDNILSHNLAIKDLKKKLINNITPWENKKVIISKIDNELLGILSWYWRSKETKCLETNIIIFNENYWNRGIGSIVYEMWIDEMFIKFKDIIRIGLTTWSENYAMIHLAKKLGFKEEARYKLAVKIDNMYYDSVSYGILKDKWIDRETIYP